MELESVGYGQEDNLKIKYGEQGNLQERRTPRLSSCLVRARLCVPIRLHPGPVGTVGASRPRRGESGRPARVSTPKSGYLLQDSLSIVKFVTVR